MGLTYEYCSANVDIVHIKNMELLFSMIENKIKFQKILSVGDYENCNYESSAKNQYKITDVVFQNKWLIK